MVATGPPKKPKKPKHPMPSEMAVAPCATEDEMVVDFDWKEWIPKAPKVAFPGKDWVPKPRPHPPKKDEPLHNPGTLFLLRFIHNLQTVLQT